MSRELGLVTLLGAEAVGRPGQRRFRLFTRSGRGTAVLWMEKEQLSNLAVAIDRALAQVTDGKILRAEARANQQQDLVERPADFPEEAENEVQVAQLRISYDESRELFLMIAVPMEILPGPGDELQALVREDQAVSLLFTHQQAQELTSTITQIVASGRPTCPLCGQPLDGGPHMCEKQNGHREFLEEE